MKKILCFIPARKGSKSIKNKNEVKIKGKELYKYTFDTAKKLISSFDVLVSTDSQKILRSSRIYGFYDNGLRPKFLSGDKVLTFDVLKYEIKKLEYIKKKKYDFILLLQVTCPFRDKNKIKKAIQTIKTKKYDSVISIADVGANHPDRMKIIKNGILKNYNLKKFENMKPRQSLKKVFIRSGSFYLIQRNKLIKKKTFVGDFCKGIVVSDKEAINIDSYIDLVMARHLITNT